MQIAFRALLTNSSAVSALVPSSRIEWGWLKQGASLPAITLTLVGHDPDMTLSGPVNYWDGRVQVDCYGATYASAKAVADAVIDRLHGHRDGVFQLIALDAQRDFTEAGSTEKPVRLSLDFITIWSKADG